MKKIAKWLKNARSVALPQSLMPAVLAVVMALGYPGFNLWLALLAVIGVVMAHLAMNLTDDYFDYKVDMLGDRDKVIRQGFRAMTVKYPYLTDGSETIKTLRQAIAQFVAVACLCGLVIFLVRSFSNFSSFGFVISWWIVAIVAATAFLGVFYSAPPFKLAYRGLGEPVIGVIFGPLLMMGVFYSAAGFIDWAIIGTSIPVGLLVLNILYTHSFIEKEGDAASNKMTLARLLGGYRANMIMVYVINFLPYILVILSVALGYLHPAYLAVLLVVPRSVWLCSSLKDFAEGRQDVPEKPYRWLGPMRDWEPVRASGVDWFLMRWLTARNILSAFCLVLIIVKLVLLIVL